MKPRTRREKEVASLSESLPPITDEQRKWAIDSLPKTAYHTKHQQWCVACGHVMATGESHCPHCGAQLEPVAKRNTTHHDRYYMTIYDSFKGYQLARHLIVDRTARKGVETNVFISEVCQEWINGIDGKITIMARNVGLSYQYVDLWKFDSPLSIKHKDSYVYGRNYMRYNIWADYEYWQDALPIIQQSGADEYQSKGIRPVDIFSKFIDRSSYCETLYKTRQYGLLDYVLNGGQIVPHAVKIANRNHYKIKDVSLWCDYIRYCEKLGLDTHNAHYVCPQDLQQAHAQVHQRWKKEQERIENEKKKEIARRNEPLYLKLHKRFLNIYFGNDNISIFVAQSVEDIRQEAEHMHHCVFDLGYYKKPTSLILFARDKKTGARIETIELDTRNFKVLQSRGVCNGVTKQHDEIVRLCNENMHLIKAVA